MSHSDTWGSERTHPILYKFHIMIDILDMHACVCSIHTHSVARTIIINLFECTISLIESVNCVEVSLLIEQANQMRMSEWKGACVQSTWISIVLTNNNTPTYTHGRREREESHTPDSICYYLWHERAERSDSLTPKWIHWVFIPLTRSQWQLNAVFFSFIHRFFKIFNYIDIDKFIMCLATT